MLRQEEGGQGEVAGCESDQCESEQNNEWETEDNQASCDRRQENSKTIIKTSLQHQVENLLFIIFHSWIIFQ